MPGESVAAACSVPKPEVDVGLKDFAGKRLGMVDLDIASIYGFREATLRISRTSSASFVG